MYVFKHRWNTIPIEKMTYKYLDNCWRTDSSYKNVWPMVCSNHHSPTMLLILHWDTSRLFSGRPSRTISSTESKSKNNLHVMYFDRRQSVVRSTPDKLNIYNIYRYCTGSHSDVNQAEPQFSVKHDMDTDGFSFPEHWLSGTIFHCLWS